MCPFVKQPGQWTISTSVVFAFFQGSWIFLQNGQKSPSLLEDIDSLLSNRSETLYPVNSQFRCWVSANCNALTTMSTRLLQSWVKVTVDAPKVSKIIEGQKFKVTIDDSINVAFDS